MRKLLLFALVLLSIAYCLLPTFSFGQGMGISTSSITPPASAILELRDTTRGLLVPRMTTAHRNAIGSPANSLLIYNTTTNQYNYYNGASWSIISPASDLWSLKGNSGINPVNDFIGTADAQPLVFRTNNVEKMRITSSGLVGIGTPVPAGFFHVATDKTGPLDSLLMMTDGGKVGIGTGTISAGTQLEVQSRGGTAIFGQESGSNPDNIGVYGYASGAAKTNTGMLGGAESALANDTAYGVIGSADIISGSLGVGVAGVADSANASIGIGISGSVTQKSTSTSGEYYGGLFTSEAKGTGATGYGVYGSSLGAATNWAGYFDDGNVYINNNLGIGAAIPAEKLDVQGRIFMLAGAAPGTTTDRLYNVGGNLLWNGTQLNSPGGTLPLGISGQTLRHNGTGWIANSILFNDGTKVGIGTTAPTSKLSVEGSDATLNGEDAAISVKNAAAGGGKWFWRAGATGNNSPAGGFSFASAAGVYALNVNSSGNVGIGTTSPTAALHVKTTASWGGAILEGTDAATGAQLNFNNNTGNKFNIAVGGSTNGTVPNDLFFWNSTGSFFNMVIKAGGNIGMGGITSPGSPLTIYNASDPRLELNSGGTSYTYLTKLSAVWNGLTNPFVIQSNSSDISITPVLNSPTSGIVIKTSGNVGIGTTAPTALLDIRTSSAALQNTMQILNTATSSPTNIIIAAYGASSGAGGALLTKYGGSFEAANAAGTNIGGFFNAFGGTNNYAIIVPSTGGNVGLGTTAPAARLHIDNTIRMGSETGTSQGPTYPAGNSGLVIRRIHSNNNAAGQIIAKTDQLNFERNGTNGGWQINRTGVNPNQVCNCMGVNNAGAFVGKALNNLVAGVTAVYTNAENMVFIHCIFGDPYNALHTTEVRLTRESTDYFWTGTVITTFNQ